jgi:hypothetical protein
MSNGTTRLQVLLVEDESDDLRQYERDFPNVFSSCQVEADIHPCDNFDEAFKRMSNPLYRYDLIISDTYKGEIKHRDAQVMGMVKKYRGTRFCPLVVYSSGVKPPELDETAFIVWADKSKPGDIERAINQLLNTNIPQLARKLHDELERSAGSYLWGFLEKNWDQLQDTKLQTPEILERLIRRRASVQLGRLNPNSDLAEEVQHITSADFYIMPPISSNYRLGHILQHKKDNSLHVLLTPHCHLEIQEDQSTPRADYVLIVPAFHFDEIIRHAYTKQSGEELPRSQFQWGTNRDKVSEKLRRHIQSPSEFSSPKGRYWFLPGFMDIPNSYCDFMRVRSIPFKEVTDYVPLAVLDTPFAEALQSCFTSFYSSVGIPNLNPLHFMHLTQVRVRTDDQCT